MEIFPGVHAFIWQSAQENNCNCYLIDGPTRVLIDPGHKKLFGHVLNGLDEIGLRMDDIGLVICTHAHPDHLESVELFNDGPSLFAIHEDEWVWVQSMEKQMSVFGMDYKSIVPDFFLTEGVLDVNGLKLHIFNTPGHSPGSMCIYLPDNKILFTGDLIFNNGVGRTDLPGGNGSQLKESILRLKALDVTSILTGHGEPVLGETEVRENFEEIERVWFNYI